MIIGPKYKIAKRLGSPIFEKTQTQKFALSEARGGMKKRKHGGGQASDFKRQLIEKQKMRYSYGISEGQLSRYVEESLEHSSDPVKALMTRLETRLDNVVYRLGLAKTRRFARQMVSHGHITVNGRRVTVPSFQVKVGDTIAAREGSKDSALFADLTSRIDLASIPAWLRLDPATVTGEMTGMPIFNATEVVFDPEQVFEFYSR